MANDFIIHVNGKELSPYEFPGSELGTNVALGSGPYTVTETNPVQNENHREYFASYFTEWVGTINDGEARHVW